MSTSARLFLILAARPGAPGVAPLLARAAEAAQQAEAELLVMLTGDGLSWAAHDGLAHLVAGGGVEVALCSRSARERGLAPASLPPWIRWSSLLQWLLARRPDEPLWSGLP